MKKKLMGIDVAGAWCKNLQKINTIEIFFYVNTSDYFCIEYNFHKIDFEMFKEILEMHKEDVEETKLYIVLCYSQCFKYCILTILLLTMKHK